MVVASFNPATDLAPMNTVLAEEIGQVKVLQADKRIGSIHIAALQGRVFVETFAETEEDALETVRTLPMSKWWSLEAFLTAGPKTSV